MKSKLEEETPTSSSLVINLYNRRKQVFIQSLQSVLQKIAQDKIVCQMLQSRTSGQFITKRIEEIVAQVIFDDRETFIDTLIQKLNAYEKLYSRDQAEMIKSLGNKILTISDSQNASEVHYARQIQSLNEQVQALQNEIVTLRTQKSDNEVSITDFTRNIRVRTLDPDYDPSSPTFMHIFGHIDLTDFKVKLKLIHTDASTSRQLVIILINKMKKILSIMNNKVKQSARAYARRTEEYESQKNADNFKANEIQHHYEEEVIPQLLARHKESMAKHKRIHQEKQLENDKLKQALSEYKTEFKAMKMNEKQLVSENDVLHKQVLDRDTQIENLRGELQKSVLVIQAQKNSIQEKDSLILRLQDRSTQLQFSHDQLNIDSQSLQKNYEEALAKIELLEDELEQVHSTMPRTERELKDVNKQLEYTKQDNQKLTKLSNERAKQISELQRKLNKMEPAYDSNQRELSDLQLKYEQISDENIEKQHKIDSMKRENDNQRQTISRLEQSQNESRDIISRNNEQISHLEMERDKYQDELNELKSKLKKFTFDNSKMEKQSKDNLELLEKQKSQIDQNNAENERLREEIRKITKKSSQLENDLRRAVADLEAAHSEIDEFHNMKEQQEQQISTNREEKNEMKRKMRELTTNAKEQEMKNNELKEENESLNSKVNELEKAVAQLKQDNSRYNDKEKQRKDNFDKIEKENQTFKNILDEINDIVPNHSIQDLPDLIRDLSDNKEFTKQVCAALGVSNPSDALGIVKNAKDSSKTLQKIAKIMGTSDPNSLSKAIQKLKDENEKLNNERQQIIQLLPNDDNIDIATLISNIVQKQKSYEDQIDSAAKFISQVLATITNSQQSPLNFPLKKNIRDDLVSLVSKIKSKADSDRKQIDSILQKAKSLGFDGDDCIKACEFIAKMLAETERQKTFETVGKELDAVRENSQKKEEELNAQIAKLKKKVKSLQVSIAQMQSQGNQRDDEQSDLIQNYEKKIQELSEELATERRVREELGKIGDGFSADTKYLKSKLSSKEMKFFTFIQQVMQQDKQAKELRIKMKKERENLLDPNLLSSKA